MENWKPAAVVFADFCRNNPALGLLGGRWSVVHFLRVHGKAMKDAGVLRQTTKGRYLLNAETFPAVAFDHLTNG